MEEYSKEALIKAISFVFQDSKLFKTSIYENVALANKNASKKEVMQVLLNNFDIELKDVEFSYQDDAKVLDVVSFTAKQGQVTALVGASDAEVIRAAELANCTDLYDLFKISSVMEIGCLSDKIFLG